MLHNDTCTKSVRLEVSGKRSRGRPKKRWRDNIKEDMNKYQLTGYIAHYRTYWMTKIMAGPAQCDGQRREKGENKYQGHIFLETTVCHLLCTPTPQVSRHAVKLPTKYHHGFSSLSGPGEVDSC